MLSLDRLERGAVKAPSLGPMSLSTRLERWPLAAPFRIAGYTFEAIEVLVVSLQSSGKVGCGEAAGVYYKSDRPASMLQQIENLRAAIEAGISRSDVQKILPPGGARNALDCAMWDLEAKLSGRHAWRIAGMEAPRPLLTTFTCGADEPAKMAAAARTYGGAQAIKLKLTGEPIDAERVVAVREALPSIWLAVDGNQGMTRESLERLLPVLLQADVALIEQPLALDQDAMLDGFESPIPIAADESVQCLADLRRLVGRFHTINIKLDKCGGLTEGLAMVHTARELGLDAMVGNMIGTSLAMAPAFILGQLCTVADLDGPVFLSADRPICVQYQQGLITCPEALWG